MVPSGRVIAEAGSRLCGKNSGGSGVPEDKGEGSDRDRGDGKAGDAGGAVETAAAGRLPFLAVMYHVLRTFLASSVRLARVVPC